MRERLGGVGSLGPDRAPPRAGRDGTGGADALLRPLGGRPDPLGETDLWRSAWI